MSTLLNIIIICMMASTINAYPVEQCIFKNETECSYETNDCLWCVSASTCLQFDPCTNKTYDSDRYQIHCQNYTIDKRFVCSADKVVMLLNKIIVYTVFSMIVGALLLFTCLSLFKGKFGRFIFPGIYFITIFSLFIAEVTLTFLTNTNSYFNYKYYDVAHILLQVTMLVTIVVGGVICISYVLVLLLIIICIYCPACGIDIIYCCDRWQIINNHHNYHNNIDYPDSLQQIEGDHEYTDCWMTLRHHITSAVRKLSRCCGRPHHFDPDLYYFIP